MPGEDEPLRRRPAQLTPTAACRACGAAIDPSVAFCPHCGARHPAATAPEPPRSFFGSVAICLRKYAAFAGRAPRAEFWYFALFSVLASLVAAALDSAIEGSFAGYISDIVDLLLLLPGGAVQFRRLHDLDRSGWWYWIVLIPLIGWVLLLVWNCTRGTPGPNRYGPDPLGGAIRPGDAETQSPRT